MRLDLLRKSWCSAQHVLIFGEAKTGKTQLMASLASKYKLLWFDLEHGVSTLFKLPLELQQNIEVISLATTLGVVVLGVLQGVVLAVGLSLLWLLGTMMRPRDAVMGKLPDKQGFHSLADFPDAKTIPRFCIRSTTSVE